VHECRAQAVRARAPVLFGRSCRLGSSVLLRALCSLGVPLSLSTLRTKFDSGSPGTEADRAIALLMHRRPPPYHALATATGGSVRNGFGLFERFPPDPAPFVKSKASAVATTKELLRRRVGSGQPPTSFRLLSAALLFPRVT
jgi:hypothetical protein